jgi:hypothetical protein
VLPVYTVKYFYQARKIRRKPLKAEDLEPDSQWAHDLGSRSSGESRHAAGGDPNEMENVKVKEEIDDDAMETEDVPSEYSFVKLYVVLEV